MKTFIVLSTLLTYAFLPLSPNILSTVRGPTPGDLVPYLLSEQIFLLTILRIRGNRLVNLAVFISVLHLYVATYRPHDLMSHSMQPTALSLYLEEFYNVWMLVTAARISRPDSRSSQVRDLFTWLSLILMQGAVLWSSRSWTSFLESLYPPPDIAFWERPLCTLFLFTRLFLGSFFIEIVIVVTEDGEFRMRLCPSRGISPQYRRMFFDLDDEMRWDEEVGLSGRTVNVARLMMLSVLVENLVMYVVPVLVKFVVGVICNVFKDFVNEIILALLAALFIVCRYRQLYGRWW